VLTTCQPSTVWCSRERLPAAAAQPAKVRQSLKRHGFYFIFTQGACCCVIRTSGVFRREGFDVADVLL
jgi:hypothetical protein